MVLRKEKIAVFINGWSTDYVEDVLEGIRREAAKESVDIFVFMTYILWDEPEVQSQCQLNIFNLPDPNDFDGAIVLTNTFNAPDELNRIRDLFQKNGVPMISTEVKTPGMAFVGTNNVTGMKQLANHLVVEHGLKDIVYVSGIVGNEECAIRKNALSEVLNEHGLTIRDDVRGDFSFNNAMLAVRDWLDSGNKLPEAFVCANDHMALGVISELDRRKINVPKEVIVTGFDKMREGRTTYPILASVSRNCDKLGEYAYQYLKTQIVRKDYSSDALYDTEFIPGESCGCKASSEDEALRQRRIKYLRPEIAFQDLQDVMLQKLRFALSSVETKQEFHDVAQEIMGNEIFFGKDYCICCNPWVFDDTDDNNLKKLGYHKEMDVLYSMKDGVSQPLCSYKNSDLYPDYKHEEGKSNTYIFVPLNHMDMIIGYIAVKNCERVIYGMGIRRLQADLNPTFVFIKQYIHAQNVNRQLKAIYMTDFLTGMYNRTGCETEIFEFCENAKKNDKNTVLLFVDIDSMKDINDRYGHLNGDIAIKATAEAMRYSMPGTWMFGRYGGDEFVAVGYLENESAAEDLRQRISDSVKSRIDLMKLSFTLSVSIGCHIIHPDDTESMEECIRLADESMYEEKRKAHERLKLELG